MATKNPTSRRAFLIELAGVGVALSRGDRLLAQEPFPTREIPGTGERLPIVGLGSSKAVLQIPTEGTEPLNAVLHMLVDQGGRVVDTSPRSEEIDAEFGRLLTQPDLREELFVAVKINTDGAEAGIAQIRQSQRLFERRTLDLLQVESLRDLDAHWPNVRAWKDNGEARHIGVTVSRYDGYERMERFMRQESQLDFVHVNYSVLETRAEERLLPLARDLGLAVLTNRPFLNGGYFGRVTPHTLPDWSAEFDCTSWAQFSLKYILAHPAVTCALTETTNPEHLMENMHAAYGRFPNAATKRRMRELVSAY